MLRIRHSSSTGMRMLTMMMMPPIVGTPFFSTPKGSILGSRSVSKIFLRFIHLMNFSPNQAERSSDMMSVSSARNEM